MDYSGNFPYSTENLFLNGKIFQDSVDPRKWERLEQAKKEMRLVENDEDLFLSSLGKFDKCLRKSGVSKEGRETLGEEIKAKGLLYVGKFDSKFSKRGICVTNGGAEIGKGLVLEKSLDEAFVFSKRESKRVVCHEFAHAARYFALGEGYPEAREFIEGLESGEFYLLPPEQRMSLKIEAGRALYESGVLSEGNDEALERFYESPCLKLCVGSLAGFTANALVGHWAGMVCLAVGMFGTSWVSSRLKRGRYRKQLSRRLEEVDSLEEEMKVLAGYPLYHLC